MRVSPMVATPFALSAAIACVGSVESPGSSLATVISSAAAGVSDWQRQQLVQAIYAPSEQCDEGNQASCFIVYDAFRRWGLRPAERSGDLPLAPAALEVAQILCLRRVSIACEDLARLGFPQGDDRLRLAEQACNDRWLPTPSACQLAATELEVRGEQLLAFSYLARGCEIDTTRFPLDPVFRKPYELQQRAACEAMTLWLERGTR